MDPLPYLITGCSGSGKSSLLAELARRRHSTFEEAGRRVVRAELERGGTALPWLDAAAFVRRAAQIAAADHRAAAAELVERSGGARRNGPPRSAFLDRGLPDLIAFARAQAPALTEELLQRQGQLRFAAPVFVAPPWQAIFASDSERPKDFAAAVREYEELLSFLTEMGYKLAMLPRVPVSARADFVEARLRKG